MQLLTEELRAQLPGIYAQAENPDPTVYAKFFTPDAGWTWFVTEGQENEEDFTFFGYVNGHCLELGYFSLKELLSVRGLMKLPIERDLHFEPAPWSEVKKKERLEDRFRGFGTAELLPLFTWNQPLFWQRLPAGLKTNVRWIVRHHSPTGFEIGYPGSGSADLALNAMAALFPCEGEGVERCFDGSVSHEAWLLHQKFKFAFLATADRDKGYITWETIEAWLTKERRNDDQDNSAGKLESDDHAADSLLNHEVMHDPLHTIFENC